MTASLSCHHNSVRHSPPNNSLTLRAELAVLLPDRPVASEIRLPEKLCILQPAFARYLHANESHSPLHEPSPAATSTPALTLCPAIHRTSSGCASSHPQPRTPTRAVALCPAPRGCAPRTTHPGRTIEHLLAASSAPCRSARRQSEGSHPLCVPAPPASETRRP